MKICGSCGGSFDGNLPKCPYCGTLNEEGAEKEYKEKLYKIRKKLDVVDDLAVDNYKSDVKLFFRVFFITLFVVACFAGIYFYTKIADNALSSGRNRRAADEEIASVVKARSIFNEWNSLYDAGEYDKLCEEFDANKKEVSSYCYDWKHYNFVYTYGLIAQAEDEIEYFKTYDEPSKYAYRAVLMSLVTSKYYLGRDQYRPLSDKDCATLEEKLAYYEKLSCETLGMTEDELPGFYSRILTGKYPDTGDVYDYIAERWGLK